MFPNNFTWPFVNFEESPMHHVPPDIASVAWTDLIMLGYVVVRPIDLHENYTYTIGKE